MLNFGNWARFGLWSASCYSIFKISLFKHIWIDTCMNNESSFAYFCPLCAASCLFTDHHPTESYFTLKCLKHYWNNHFLPTVLEIWRLIWLIVFTSYARIRIKTRVPPERGRSSWQLGQVLQVGRGPRWRRGKGIISSSWLRSWLGITISMMMHVVVASLFFRHSWCSLVSTASFFVVDEIRHSSSQTTIIRIIWNTHRIKTRGILRTLRIK